MSHVFGVGSGMVFRSSVASDTWALPAPSKESEGSWPSTLGELLYVYCQLDGVDDVWT